MASKYDSSYSPNVWGSEDLWEKAFENLKAEDKISLNVTRADKREILEEVLSMVQGAEQTSRQKRWKWKNRKGEYVIIRDVFLKMVAWIERFKGIGDVIVQYDPGHAALPWAVVRFVLQAAVNDIRTHGAMLEGLEVVFNLILRYEVVERLYLRRKSGLEQKLKEAIEKLYTCILEYLLEAHRYFTQKTLVRIAKSVFQLEETTNAFVANLKRHSNEVDAHVRLVSGEIMIDTENIVGQFRDGLEILDWEIVDLKQLLSDLEEPIKRLATQLSSIQDNLLEGERLKIFEWLTTVQYMSHHRSKSKELLAQSGGWLLQKLEFVEWLGSSCSSILWLHGIPGSGKSMLVAHVINYIQDRNSVMSSPASLAFFYCARNANEPERSDPVEVLRCILEQLSCSDLDMPIRSPVTKAYLTRKREARGRRFERLELEEAVDVILELLESNPATIVIDGLDECDPAKRQDLLDALRRIIKESDNVVKVFVSSRDDHDLVHRLSQTPNLYIHATDNSHDIRRFVASRLQEAISKEKILCGQVSKELQETIEHTLIQKASGMFRLVSLHLLSLCDPDQIKTKANVLHALAHLPPDLKRSYDVVLAQIKSSRQPNPELADRVMKWLLYAREPLGPDAFIVAICSDRIDQELMKPSEILSICNNLVIYDGETRRFRFAHLSVQEYLEHIEDFSKEHSTASLAQQCISWLYSWENATFGKGSCILWKRPLEILHQSPVSVSELPFEGQLIADVSRIQVDYCNASRGIQSFCRHVDLQWAGYAGLAGHGKERSRLSQLLQNFLLFSDSTSPNSGREFCRWVDRVRNEFQVPCSRSSPPNPIFVACAFNLSEIVARIIRKSPSATTATNSNGINCAQVAARCNQPEVIRTLFRETKKLNVPNEYWQAAINEATSMCCAEALKALLDECGEGFIDQGDLRDFIQQASGHHESQYASILRLLFQNNQQLRVTEEVLTELCKKVCFDGASLLQQLIRITQDIKITNRVINIAAMNDTCGQIVLIELLDLIKDPTIMEGAVSALLTHRDGHWATQVLERKGIPVKVSPKFSPRLQQIQTVARKALEADIDINLGLSDILMDQEHPDLELSWKYMMLARGMELGDTYLRLILAEKPKISQSAINVLVSQWDKKMVRDFLKVQRIEITDEVVRAAAGNLRSGPEIMDLLLEGEFGYLECEPRVPLRKSVPLDMQLLLDY